MAGLIGYAVLALALPGALWLSWRQSGRGPWPALVMPFGLSGWRAWYVGVAVAVVAALYAVPWLHTLATRATEGGNRPTR